ncbi:plastocyanin/azurin family copper-binding protein [Catalinimonas niigatensis]|uniref:plastocyanin/azurin family copper-binding protein n=1 Tax=Catalinimonas niigatensis TaxID=1397264 RepID=UPI00266704E7|nr:plastocyanin/azurin family copper-binding protein [Catalinimonas niigatensis]WPP49480.1 plastocyanin/azurin family copper-binding protein [Catalinimonas niigatensis]
MRIHQLPLILFLLLLGGVLALSSFIFQQAPEKAVREIVIKAISGLQYDTVRFQVSPGETIKITLVNTDEMAHNMVITAPDRREEIVDLALAMGAAGQDQHFVPKSDWVLAYAPVLKPEESYSFTFTAPQQEDVYPYVCTYPGHGSVMYGAIYVTNQKMPPLAQDEKTAQGRQHPYPDTYPKVYRTFLPDTGPASMAIGMTDSLSYCWDAGACRFRYLWKGGFVDMQKAWGGKGKERAEIVGEVFYREQSEAPFRIGSKDHQPVPSFMGYRMQDGLPTFTYRLDKVEVSERITPTLEKPGNKRLMQFKDLKEPIWFVRPTDQRVDVYVNKGKWEGNYLRLSPEEAKAFTITITEKKPEI